MEDKNQFADKSKQIDGVLNNFSSKLNAIEKEQTNIVKGLGKKTDEQKIAKVKKQIEAL